MTSEAHLDDEVRIASVLAQAEAGPTAFELRDAPVMRRWSAREVSGDPGVIRLDGFMTGHPIYAHDRITTAPVVAFGPGFQWVLTLNGWRWCRLHRESFAAAEAGQDEVELGVLQGAVEDYRAQLAAGGGRPIVWL